VKVRLYLIVFIVLGALLSACGSKEVAPTPAPKAELAAFERTPLFKQALDYNSISRIEGCVDEVPRDLKYHNCRDSKAIYTRALSTAKAMDKPLMVIFGFNKCPYCIKLESEIMDPRKPLRSYDAAQYFSKAEHAKYKAAGKAFKLPFIRLHARSDHGLVLADELGITEMANEAGWHRVWSPFVVFVNPRTGAMTSESKWEAKEIYCDWAAGVAASLEKIDMGAAGEPVTARKRCPKG
jgi:thioredoxin-related protein